MEGEGGEKRDIGSILQQSEGDRGERGRGKRGINVVLCNRVNNMAIDLRSKPDCEHARVMRISANETHHFLITVYLTIRQN